MREHPHPTAERLRRQITERAIIQAAGRARAGLRAEDEPLDIHLWTDVPVPELGPVEPVLWDDLKTGPDGLMLTVKWRLVRNYIGRRPDIRGDIHCRRLRKAPRGEEESLFPYRESPIGKIGTLLRFYHLCKFTYQREGAGYKPAEAVFFREVADPRGWLEERLGPLAYLRWWIDHVNSSGF